MDLRLILDGKNTPEYNIAADESLFILHSGGAIPPTVRIWGLSRSAVMLGRFSKVGETTHKHEMGNLGIQAIRRFTGGGVTFNDSEGDIGWAYVSTGQNVVAKYNEAAEAIHIALLTFGIESSFNGTSGIFVNNGKISGIAGARSRSTILVHGTLLYDPDLSIMDRVLKPLSNGKGKPVSPASLVTTLSAETGKRVTEREVIRALPEGFSTLGDLRKDSWTDLERDLIVRLERQYASTEWNFRM